MIDLLRRDLLLAARSPGQWLLPLAFFIAALALFPLGVGADAALLSRIAPGVVWVCALLAMMLSVGTLFTGDWQDGTLEQMLIGRHWLPGLVAVRVLAHWLQGGAPLVLLAPLAGLLFNLDAATSGMLALALLLGTPVLSLLGALGGALTLGLRNGATLVFLLVLPLAVPALIFGSGAVVAAQHGESAQAPLSLLGALLILTTLVAPPATAAALRIAVE
ncbi:heme exporter protein CcmB [Ideonella sp. 4Y16]|uniref:Heme exporter protein B n=1 Tax=Ideonella alba TaxID=2824118 RepID=A0A941BFW5_9BURK|nr:heme exporter protein CcmB [Ideonella alba]MBQ0929853.1 heme exporter protein CcmB [Ideonella alba]MBQ0942085.1 heme exporter protein CcmB [Ideonella alba]